MSEAAQDSGDQAASIPEHSSSAGPPTGTGFVRNRSPYIEEPDIFPGYDEYYTPSASDDGNDDHDDDRNPKNYGSSERIQNAESSRFYGIYGLADQSTNSLSLDTDNDMSEREKGYTFARRPAYSPPRGRSPAPSWSEYDQPATPEIGSFSVYSSSIASSNIYNYSESSGNESSHSAHSYVRTSSPHFIHNEYYNNSYEEPPKDVKPTVIQPDLGEGDVMRRNATGVETYIKTVNLEHLQSRTRPESQPAYVDLWRHSSSSLEDGSQIDLNAVRSSQRYSEGDLKNTITLNCDIDIEDPEDQSDASIWWMHVHRSSLNSHVLENIVINCPYITKDAMNTTLHMFEQCLNAEENEILAGGGKYLDSGLVMRFDGHDQYQSDEASVTFVSGSFVALRGASDAKFRKIDDHIAPTLLQTRLRDDYSRESRARIRSGAHLFEERRSLHVPQIWCLMIDKTVLITMGELTLAQLAGHSLVFNRNPQYFTKTIKVVDPEHAKIHTMKVSSNSTYTEFLDRVWWQIGGNYHTSMDFTLRDEGGILMNTIRWLHQMKSKDTSPFTLTLVNFDDEAQGKQVLVHQHSISRMSANGIQVPEHRNNHHPRDIGSNISVQDYQDQSIPSEVFDKSRALVLYQSKHPVGSMTVFHSNSWDPHQALVLHPDPLNLGFQPKPFFSWTSSSIDGEQQMVSAEPIRVGRLLDAIDSQMKTTAGFTSKNRHCQLQDLGRRHPSLPRDKFPVEIETSHPMPLGRPRMGSSLPHGDVKLGRHKQKIRERLIKMRRQAIQFRRGREKSFSDTLTESRVTNRERLKHWLESPDSPNVQSDSAINPSPAIEALLAHGHQVMMPQVLDENSFANIPGMKPNVMLTSRHITKMRSMMSALVTASINLTALFVPLEEHQSHILFRRHWGCLDRILKHSEISLVPQDLVSDQEWIIKDFSADLSVFVGHSISTSAEPTYMACDSCAKQTVYESIEAALRHIHCHIQHEDENHNDIEHEWYDDPCLLWLQPKGGQRHDRWEGVMKPIVESLLNCLIETHARAKDLVLSVSYADGDVTKMRISSQHLPPSLVRAFQFIVSIHQIVAQRMAFKNLDSGDSKDGPLLTRFNKHRKSILKCFDMAAKELHSQQFGKTSSYGVNVEPIGREYITIAILANLQSQIVYRGTRTDAVGLVTSQLRDIEDAASLRPRRHLFTDINRIELQLGALDGILSTQWAVMRKFLTVVHPASFQREPLERKQSYLTESTYIYTLQALLHAKHEQIETLQEHAAELKLQLKQSIDIVEEGHGKAIRVFTIVTLFFLPMSFCTGYLGMNTSDIRDMDQNQSFFWQISLPVTAGVIALAMIYGYKWDVIVDICGSIRDAYKDRREERKRVADLGSPSLTYPQESTDGGSSTPGLRHRNNRGIFLRWTNKVEHGLFRRNKRVVDEHGV